MQERGCRLRLFKSGSMQLSFANQPAVFKIMRKVHARCVRRFCNNLHAEDRTASLLTCIFTLTSTIVGGGVLSLPYAFRRCGLLFGPVVLIAIAIMSDFSVYTLLSCARRGASAPTTR